MTETGEYPRIFHNVQNCALCEKDLKDTKHDSRPSFGAKIWSDICPWTVSVPWSSQFYARGKLFASRNRWRPRTNILVYFRAKWRLSCLEFLYLWNTVCVVNGIFVRYNTLLGDLFFYAKIFFVTRIFVDNRKFGSKDHL